MPENKYSDQLSNDMEDNEKVKRIHLANSDIRPQNKEALPCPIGRILKFENFKTALKGPP